MSDLMECRELDFVIVQEAIAGKDLLWNDNQVVAPEQASCVKVILTDMARNAIHVRNHGYADTRSDELTD